MFRRHLRQSACDCRARRSVRRPTAAEWEFFELPERADLILGYTPGSEQAVSILPATGVSAILFDSMSFDRVTLDTIDPIAWQSAPSVELWPGETLALRTAEGRLYKLELVPLAASDDPAPVPLRYAELSVPGAVISTLTLGLYEALDLDSGETFTDPTIASVIFCDGSVIDPTPTPSVVPEPGSGGLLLLGLFGVFVSWRLARRQGRRFWMLLLFGSLLLSVQGVDFGTLIAQNRACLLLIERDGSGSGRVVGDGIDCGDSCTRSSGSGEVFHVKAIADEDSRFIAWQVNGDPYQGHFHMSGDTILTALFDAKHPPTAVNDRYSTDEDVALEIPAPGILANDSDPDGDALSVELVQAPLHGALTFNPDGSFTYLPESDFHGIDQFLYRATDGELESALAAVTFEVRSLSDAPTADDLSVETVMNNLVEIALQGHDPDGDELLYQIIDPPANGTFSGADTLIEYTPNPDFTGQDSFTYLVNDGTSDSNLATVTITVRDIDLAIGGIDLSATDFDPQTMTLSGTATVTFDNAGAETIDGSYALQVFVKDLQQDTTIDLGTVTISDPLAPGGSLTVNVPVDGVMPFKDVPVYAFVDSQNAIAESDEENNLTHTLVDCQMEPAEPGSFDPVLEWEWTESSVLPDSLNVMSTPVVIDLNGDGLLEIIFGSVAELRGSGVETGILRVLSGNSGEEIFTVADPDLSINAASSIAAGDIDLDNYPEIISSDSTGRRLLVFEHDGTFKWRSPILEFINWGGPAIADLNNDGIPEIVIGRQALDRSGNLLWTGTGGQGGHFSLVADIDLNGTPEIIAGNTVYTNTGEIVWQLSLPDGKNGVANFDNDPYPEIVLISNGNMWLIAHTGEVEWGPVRFGIGGGPPTIADVDGDGEPEIGVAGAYSYHVFKSDGTLLWNTRISDRTSASTGSSVFDFDGDGALEVVYSDELYLRIYNGSDGTVLFRTPLLSYTWHEYPVVVDVDNDHNAEIVAVANHRTLQHGVYVFGDANDSWVNTRPIWNQHSYHITNVNDDGTIPQFEANSWQEHNTYRCNLSADALACEDYSASYLRVDTTDFPNSATIIARIGNSGIVDAAFPLNVAFYKGDPQNGGTLLGTTVTQSALVSGDYEDVSLVWDAPTYGLHELYVVVDDDGSGQGKIRESDETNNTAFTLFEKPDYDLAALQVDPANSVFDPQTMGLSGSVAVTFENLGSSTIESDYTIQVYIEDSADGSQQILGSLPVSDSLAAGETLTVDVPVNGTLLFKDQPVYAFVDSDNALDETNEENNLSHTLVDCQGTPPEGVAQWSGNGHCYEFIGEQLNWWDAVDLAEQKSTQGMTAHLVTISSQEENDFIFSSIPRNFSGFKGAWLGGKSPEGWLVGPETDQPFAYTNWGGIEPNNSGYAYMSIGTSGPGSPGQWLDDSGVQGVPSGLDPVVGYIVEYETRSCEDYSASFVRLDASDYPSSATIMARIGNSGMIDAASPLHVAVYDGDPQTGGILLGTVTTQNVLVSDTYEDVSLVWNAPTYGLHEIYVAVDDDGSGNGSFRESDEENNIASATLFVGDAPTADAGAGRSVPAGATVTLDGSGSSDPAGYTPLTNSWQIISRPDGSSAALDDASSATPSLTADLTGTYIIQLVVENTEGIQSAADSVTIVVPESTPPSVSIVSPADGTEDPADGSLTIQADASDPDGTIVRVEFYTRNTIFGGEKILFAEDETAPYSVPWTIVEPGIHKVVARAYDDSGAWTDSAAVHIVVQNGQPEIISEPTYSAPIGELYSYDVEAVDPNGDILTYSLEYGPAGMTIDSASGLISWTPTEAQVGQQQYRVIVEDGRGAGAGQTVECFVPDLGNTPPQIVSVPVFTARVGEEYLYDVEATDAESDPLSFRLMKAPDGMGLNPQSGLIAWTPTDAQIGEHAVTVVADDGRNGIGGQSYTLTVRTANLPPTVSISAPAAGREVEEGSTLTIRAEASDPSTGSGQTDGIARVEFFVDGVSIGDTSAAPYELDWPAAGLGEHTVYAVATDNDGASTESAPVTFTVTESFGDFLRPEVTLTISSTVVSPGDTITVWSRATDNSGSVSTTVSINGEELALNPDGSATYTVGDEAEILTIDASASDADGNSGYVSREVRVLVPGDTTDPVADISAPEILTKIYTPAEIVGTAADDTLLRYTLEYSPKDRNAWTTFASGAESVTDGVLGTLDPTLLLNGLYDIRLSVEDASGNISIAETVYQIDGNMKIGLFTISFNDLTIPVSGIPITVTRTYDSRDKIPPAPFKKGGDFGVGWSLSTSNITVEESASPGGEWEQIAEGGGSILNPFTTYKLNETTPHTVTVTYPGGATDEFRMKVTPRQSFPYKVEYVDVSFEAESGTFSTLEAEGGAGLAVVGNVNGPVQLADPQNWSEYNPDQYTLTRMDGTVIVLNQHSGIETITEPNGNVLTFSEDGITHSNGKSVQFIRDDEGRISEIIDPMGASVSYDYDSYGDLVKVTDQEGYDTRFTYEGNHYLKDIIDPRGVRATRNEYYPDGRLWKTIDPDGHEMVFDHDIDGRTEVVRDRLGYPTIITYDDRGNVLQETDAEGNTKTYSYDERDNLLVEEDQRGYSWVHSYTSKDLMASKSNPLGYTVSAGYNAKGQVESLTDSGGTLLENLYDGKGNLTQITEANGAVSSFNYNDRGQPEGYTDQLSKQMHFGYDSDGNVSAMSDPDGSTIGFSYDENGRVLQKSSRRSGPSGTETLKTVNVYDKLGRLVQNTDAEGYTSEVVYNAIGKQSAYTDKRGFTTEYVYDALGNLERTISPDGTEESYTYDAEGRTLSSTNRQGKTSSYTYDKIGRQIAAEAPDGSTTSTEYDARGQVLAQTDERGRTTNYAYDEAGRNTLVTNALGQQTEYSYELNGSLHSMTDAAGRVTSYQYDSNGRRTGTSFADGSSVSTSYDEAGRVLSERDQAGRETQYAYDWRGKLLSVTDALNQLTSFSYDEVGNMLSQTDAEGQTTRFEYDNLGRMTRRILPLGQNATMTYDGEDNLIERTDFNGATISFDYDSDGRVLSKQYPDGNSTSYSYAPDGSQDTVADSRGATTLSYDDMGRLESRSDPETGTIGYGYDPAGNKTSVISPSGSVSYSYDELNRLETVNDPATGTTRYSYDTVGNLKTVSYPNGTRADYSYDLLNRLTLLENRGSDGSLISSYSYTLDAAGNRKKVEEEPSGRVVDYDYDETDRLLEERITNPDGSTSVITYTYDKVGNRKTKTENGFTTTYQYDANNRLVKEDDVTYSYDDNGNLIEKQGAEEQIVYAYDYDNHLVRVETTRYDATIVVTYDYDADGNRVRKVIDDTVFINYLVDTNRDYAQVVEERDGGGNLLVRYVYGHDLISQTRDSATHYYHYDGLGSTRALTGQSGIVTDTYTYDAFGLLLEQSGTTENQYLYRGEQFDEELGLYYLRARYMDPAIGRFVTMDGFAGSIQDPYSLHKYLYANANPMTYSDPSGNFSIGELNVSTAIRGILDRHNQLMQITRYRVMRGALIGAVSTMIEKRLTDQEIKLGDVLLGAATGGGLAGVGSAISAVNKFIPPELLANFCKLKNLVPLLGGLGLAVEFKGVVDAIQQEKYDLALYRSSEMLHSIFELRYIWKSFACFTAETLVYTEDGHRPIKDIEVGDNVYAEDVETGEKGLKRVAEVFVRETRVLVHLFFNEMEIKSTPDHPFWVPEKGWIHAGDLKVGEDVKLYSGKHEKVTFIRKEILTHPIKVYNLRVEGWHTYFISTQNLLVHNATYKFNTWLKKGASNTSVYLGTDLGSGEISYTGITKDFSRRAREWGGKYDINEIMETVGLTRQQARCIEEVLIIDNRTKFDNVYHSISPQRDIYNEAVAWGRDWLKTNKIPTKY